MLDQQIASILIAYERERRQWDFWVAVPSDCDGSYFRLRAMQRLNAPELIILREIKLLRRKLATLQSLRLEVTVH
jgi:hypothetical protein